MDEVRANWELRARQSGTQLSGVLFRGLSEQANAAMHAWHAWVVEKAFADRMPRNARVLDLGCGYGRLSSVLAQKRLDLELFGQDVSLEYCRLFHQRIGNCIAGNAEALPFLDRCFNGVLAVTSLMYAARPQLPNLMMDVRRVLRPGGCVLLLDPGRELQRLVAGIRGPRAASATGGVGFERREYLQLLARGGFSILACGGNPRLSMALLLQRMIKIGSSGAGNWLARIARADCRLSGYSGLALHRWILASRSADIQ